MTLLAIDTSGSHLSVAVCKDGQIVKKQTLSNNHCELAMKYIDECMKNLNIKPENLEGILCMKGPGSFTGLRIGYSIAKGLSLSLNIPFYAIPTLECMAFPYITEYDTVIPVIKARKNAFFYAVYGKNGVPVCIDAETLQICKAIEELSGDKSKKIILTGQDAAAVFDELPQDLRKIIIMENDHFGYSQELINVAKFNKICDNYNSTVLFSGPDYYRKTDAEINLNQYTPTS